MSVSLTQNPRVQKSIRRLQNIGLKPIVHEVSKDWIIVAFDRESIMRSLGRIIRRSIEYQSADVVYDREKGILEVHFWRGNRPPIRGEPP